MKNLQAKPKCDKCNKPKELYKFTYRYTDKARTYLKSGRKIIHTGYLYVCQKCLKTITS